MCLNPIMLKDGQFVPCRKCSQCRMSRAREWAVRCHCERQNHLLSCFITLTYAPEFNPIHLVKKDVQDFIKRLRKFVSPVKIKYFLCGEYGDRQLRPHYHIIIFGYDFPDKMKLGTSKRGYPYYRSEILANLWKFGLHTVQDVSFNTCVYSALYANKAPKALPVHLQAYPEFNLMSQGLGNDVIIDKFSTFIQTDEIYIDGRKYKIPESVLRKLFVHLDSSGCIDYKDETYEELKIERKRKFAELYPDLADIMNRIAIAESKLEDDKSVNRLQLIHEYYDCAYRLYVENEQEKQRNLKKFLFNRSL